MLLLIPAVCSAECGEYKVIDHGDRAEVICEGTVTEIDKARIGTATAPTNHEVRVFAEKYMEYATEKQRMDLERAKAEAEIQNAKIRQYDRPPGFYSGRTFQPEEVKKGSIVDANGRVIDGVK